MKRVLVIDFGGQYSQLIARRVRECRVYSELVPYDTPAAEIAEAEPAGIILSGGPRSVNEANAPQVDPALFELGVPVMGICYGLQLIAKLKGGRVERTGVAEYGGRPLRVTSSTGLFTDQTRLFMRCAPESYACPPPESSGSCRHLPFVA